MSRQVHVQVPADLWQQLDREGFESVASFRDPDQWAQVARATLTVADQGAELAANLVTVLLGREAIRAFAEQVRGWVGRRQAQQSTTFAADLTVRANGDETRIMITHTGSGDLDTEAVVRLLTSAVNGGSSEEPVEQ